MDRAKRKGGVSSTYKATLVAGYLTCGLWDTRACQLSNPDCDCTAPRPSTPRRY